MFFFDAFEAFSLVLDLSEQQLILQSLPILHSIFSAGFGADTEKTEKAIKLLEKELKKLRDQKLGPVQLQQAKHKFIGQIALGEENRMGLIISMSKSLLDFNRVDSLEEVFAKINKVTAPHLLEIANEMFDPTQLSTLIFNPKE